MIDRLTLNDWHPVAIASALLVNNPLNTRLLGTDLVIMRSDKGALTGIVMDADRKTAECRLSERYGFVWATLGQPDRPLFEVAEFSDGLGRRFVPWGAIRVRTSAPRMVENFFDLAHFSFVHPGMLGSESRPEVLDYKLRIDTEANELWANNCRIYQPKASAALSEPSMITYHYRVVRPWAVLFYKTSVIFPGRDNLSGMFVQQVEEELCIAHAFAYVFNNDGSNTSILHFAQEIFAQDRPIVQSQEPRKLPLSPQVEKPTRADRLSVAYRQWLVDSGVNYGVIRP